MASFNFRLDDYEKKNGKRRILLHIIIDRNRIKIFTGHEVEKKFWDDRKQQVKTSGPAHYEINDSLRAKREEIEKTHALLQKAGGIVTTKKVAERVVGRDDFHAFAQQYVDGLMGPTELRTQNTYNTMLRALKRHSPTLSVQQIDADFIESFRAYLVTQGQGRTTVVKRLMQLRALYRRHPARAYPSPWEVVKVGTMQRADIMPLSLDELAQLEAFEPRTPGERRALDVFLFSFYALGMRPGNVLLLERSAVQQDAIVYQELKKMHLGSERLYVPIHDKLRAILDRQPAGGRTVFGLVEREDPRVARIVQSAVAASLNVTLKKIAVALGWDRWLSLKLARHTFAAIANELSNRDVYRLQQALGHSRISTTEIYLGRDNRAAIDIARKVYG